MPYTTIRNSILECIGQTPIVKLQKIFPSINCNLYVKCEMFNPTLSIKDRIVAEMICDLENKKILSPGMTIIEASSGNTGTSLAMVGAVKGYNTIVVVPHKISPEKIASMEYFGAKVIISPKDADVNSKDHYLNKAKFLAEQNDYIFLNQYASHVNVITHSQMTAKEIWQQMHGKIDYLIACASSGGTITGVARYLKKRNPKIKIILPDPVGSIFYHHFYNQPLGGNIAPYSTEGAGKDKICSIHDFSLIDDVIQFTDKDAMETSKQLARKEGIIAGESSGGALYVVNKLDKKTLTGKNILVILPDSGFKYLSKNSRHEQKQTTPRIN